MQYSIIFSLFVYSLLVFTACVEENLNKSMKDTTKTNTINERSTPQGNAKKPDKALHVLFEAFKHNDFDRINPYIPTRDDMVYMIEKAIAQSNKPDEIARTRNMIDTILVQGKIRIEKQFTNSREKAIKDGIDWANSSFLRIDHTFQTEPKTAIKTGNSKVYFSYAGTEYYFQATSAELPSGWKLGNNIVWPKQ